MARGPRSPRGAAYAQELCSFLGGEVDDARLPDRVAPSIHSRSGTAADFTPGNVPEGTPQYVGPEQLRGESVSSRSDIFSLGPVMYELFAGKRAFEANTIGRLMELHSEGTASPRAPEAR
ncbi:MAG: hypothetical protein HYU52_09395 [Acidobacteria bacterium]|nr:hypothetical protein [Acidobacteriota bacterium]